MGKKKVNPRRIPLAKKEIDRDKIIEAAMKHDMALPGILLPQLCWSLI